MKKNRIINKLTGKQKLIDQYNNAITALAKASDRSDSKVFSKELSELMETKLSSVPKIGKEPISGVYSYGSFDPEKASVQRIQEKIAGANKLAEKYGVNIPSVVKNR